MGDDSHAPQPGDRIGRYRVERELGRGGMGVVYEALDEELERPVALKILPNDAMGDEERRARFLREARAAASVTHRNIAVVHDVGQHEGRVFLAMELIEGETLAARIDRDAVSLDEALFIAMEIASGLAKAHQLGIVHRDLKPNNVMLDADGGVRILDFGLAKRVAQEDGLDENAATVSALTTAGAVLGTPGYMAPEQAEGHAVDTTADVFAFGTMLYEMLTGTMAFGGESTARRIAATLEKDPEPLTELAPDVPPELAELVDECLAKDPTKRPIDGDAVLSRLAPLSPHKRPSLRPVRSARIAIDADSRAGDATTLRGGTLPSPRSTTRRAWWLFPIAAAAVGGLGWLWVNRSDAGADEVDAPEMNIPELIADRDTVTGCPVFEVTGQEGGHGPLGAAAAHVTCGVWELFSASDDRALRPVELLDVPELPVDDFPIHPYGDPEARTKSLRAASKLPLMIDGRAAFEDDGVRVTIELKRHGQAEPIATTSATDRFVVRAAREATMALAAQVGLDPNAPVPATDAMYFGPGSIRDLVAAKQHASAVGYDHDIASSCEGVADHNVLLAAAHARACGHSEADPDAFPTWPANLKEKLDQLPEAGRLFWSALLRVNRLSPAEARDLAERIAPARAQQEDDDRSASALAIAEALTRFRGGSPDEASALLDRAAQLDPSNCDARATSFQLALENSDRRPLARTAVAWCPTSDTSWTSKYFLERGPDRDLDDIRTAYVLSDRAPDIGLAFGESLLTEGRVAEARNVASRYLSGRSKQVGHYLLGSVEVASGNVAAGLDRLERLVRDTDRLGDQRQFRATVSTIFTALDAARLANRDQAFADLVLERFLLTDPPAIEHIGPVALAVATAHASEDVAARAVPRIEQLGEQGRLWKVKEVGHYLEGALAYRRGDAEGAAEAWRSLVPKPVFRRYLRAEVFDEAGEPEIAWTITEAKLEIGRKWTSLDHALQARRASHRGDDDRARALAAQYVDAFGSADVQVPLLDEMRALLGR